MLEDDGTMIGWAMEYVRREGARCADRWKHPIVIREEEWRKAEHATGLCVLLHREINKAIADIRGRHGDDFAVWHISGFYASPSDLGDNLVGTIDYVAWSKSPVPVR